MIEIRPALVEEGEILTAIAVASKSHWGYPESWLAAWREDLTFTPALIASNEVFVAAETDGKDLRDKSQTRAIACYVLAGLAGPDPVENGELELQHFWIHPSQIGRGLGRQLFEHAVEQARARGASALMIDSDPHAEAFYGHMGAARVGATRADIEGVRRELPRMRYEL